MIIIQKNDNELIVKGHANQSIHGRDIVCAAVSTAIIMTINQIELFSKLDKIEYVMDEGFFKIKKRENDSEVSLIIKNLEFTLENLKEQYPKYIK